eukprot:144009-Rhodomonas_salina.3
MGSRQYADDKCTEEGITEYIPLSKTMTRENAYDEETQQYNKTLGVFLCPSCQPRAIAVDDVPSFWKCGDHVRKQMQTQLPIVEWDDALTHRAPIQTPSVIAIPPYNMHAGDAKRDSCLIDLADYLLWLAPKMKAPQPVWKRM